MRTGGAAPVDGDPESFLFPARNVILASVGGDVLGRGLGWLRSGNFVCDLSLCPRLEAVPGSRALCFPERLVGPDAVLIRNEINRLIMRTICRSLVSLLLLNLTAAFIQAEQLEIPRRHDRPPGPPLSAEEAARKMTVPEGFSVEVVAAEPDVMNPVAMFIDERGRYWVTESFEYPRREPGPGRDRIKILEDTNGDGKVDKVTVFAEGLNIPSGIAVGYGGVWVFNSPDLLFLQDTDGDGQADKTEVLLTGFGRTDTHELPNSLTWGPDGWLYGLNGVFNYSKVSYGRDNPNFEKNKDKVFDFTCALFRIHPRTKEFQIFAEGTSNPWGIAVNEDGEFFISACVIDHLWHIVETGYYIRQGGPYPAHTWPIPSIVKHKHQKAAYCGITWFDSDAYPPEYRGVLYMGNIHGGCINADIAERDGATYKGRPHPGFTPQSGAWDDDQYGTIAKTGDPEKPQLADFLTANDAWFMPVAEKTGPDGCLYVLDWYDRYHCYQDANADPAGVERAKGRLYRVRYKETPHAQPFNLNEKSDDQLIELLGSPNIYDRETAQRLLGERNHPQSAEKLEALLFSPSISRTQRLHALFARAAFSHRNEGWRQRLLTSKDFVLRAWGIRLLREQAQQGSHTADSVDLETLPLEKMTPAEQLQLLVTARKSDPRSLSRMLQIAAISPDQTMAQVAWNGLVPVIQAHPNDYLQALMQEEKHLGNLTPLLVRSMSVICSQEQADGESIGKAIAVILRSPDVSLDARTACLAELRRAFQNGALSAEKLAGILKSARSEMNLQTGALGDIVTTLNAFNGDPSARAIVHLQLLNPESGETIRVNAMNALIALKDPEMLPAIKEMLARKDLKLSRQFRVSVLDSISQLRDPQVADVLLKNFPHFEPDIQPKVIEVLTQRPVWSLTLLKAIDAGQIDKSLVNLNQLSRMNTFKQPGLQELIARHYGTIRAGARSDRQGVINKNRDFLRGTPGDPVLGVAVFKRVCAQCHKIYGEGSDVGPEITRNGRNNWDQLIQNVLDPSAVIGPGYQARMIATEDGRVLTGLPVEDSAERVVLKLPGGKLETIPKDQIEQDKLSELSLMPEEIEKLMTPQELADLFAYLSLDRPPEDSEAKILPGAPAQKRRE